MGISDLVKYMTDLFWPEFVIHDGCLLRKAGFTQETYRGFHRQTGGDRKAIEWVINHRHIPEQLSLFQCWEDDTPRMESLIAMGRLLKEMWEAKLARDFHGRKVIVELDETDGPDQPVLSVYSG
jgi:hypothetical protein